jgi:hypothetical protein
MRDRTCIGLLVLIVTLLFADVLFLGTSFYVRDLFAYHYPMKHVVREIISRGEFPWWNPYFASGQPMAANPAYEIFYPPQGLIFIGPYRFGFSIHILFHIYLAVIGAFLFFRSIPLRRDVSCFGALSFALSSFFLGTSTNLPTFFVWSWAGLCGWAVLRMVRGGSVAVPALIFAIPLLVCEPISVFQLFVLMCVVAGVASWRRLGIAMILALLIAAVQIAPAIDHARDSVRSRGFSFDLVADYSLAPARILELAAPFAVTPRSAGDHRTHYFLTLYCGAAVLILTIAGLATRQRGWKVVLAIAGIGFLVAIGDATPLLRILYASGLRSIRYPEKFIAIVLVTFIGFATLTAERLLDGDRKLRTAAIMTGVATALIAAMSPYALIAFAVWTIILWRIGTHRAWHVAALAVLLIELGSVATRVIPRLSSDFFTPPHAVASLDPSRAIFHRGEWAQRDVSSRFDAISPAVTTRNALRPFSPAAWGLRTALEYDFDETFLLPTHVLLDAMQKRGNSGDPHWSEPFMAMASIGYVADYDAAAPLQSPVVIRRVPYESRFRFAHGGIVTRAAETSSSADVDVATPSGEALIITITRHKYWSATIDGRLATLLPVNLAYQAVMVPAGTHHISLRYRNPVVIGSAFVSLLALLGTALTVRR